MRDERPWTRKQLFLFAPEDDNCAGGIGCNQACPHRIRGNLQAASFNHALNRLWTVRLEPSIIWTSVSRAASCSFIDPANINLKYLFLK